MMTVTEENLDQVIPLARALEGKVDSFNFNAISSGRRSLASASQTARVSPFITGIYSGGARTSPLIAKRELD
jgi:hypothetical protein